MCSRLASVFCALALLQILGGHWAVLQTGAWIGMIVQYSQQSGLNGAIAQTFDGEHPCPVCKAIQDGKKQEQNKRPVLQAKLKQDFLSPWNRFQFHQGWLEVKYPGPSEAHEGLTFEPAVPPPRTA